MGNTTFNKAIKLKIQGDQDDYEPKVTEKCTYT